MVQHPDMPPVSPGKWLLNNVFWTVVCVGGWLLVNTVVLAEPYDRKTPDEPLLFLGFVIAHSLVWWRALPGLRAVEEGSTLEMIAFTWQVALVAFQLVWLGIMLLILAAPLFYEPYSFQ
jgi:hypothetical protein